MNQTHGYMLLFYVMDQEKNKMIMMRHSPTENMLLLADYFTKPLQGSVLVKMHYFIMGAEYGDGDHHG